MDTIIPSMQKAILELINRPELLKKIRQEIDSIVGQSRRLINESDIPKLPYLRAFLKEVPRLHPQVPLLRRKCNQDCTINGYKIRAGTKVLINAYMIMRDPSSWENPEEFLPERFLDVDGDDRGKDQSFKYLPFGAGRRACLGASYASAVLHTTIGALVQCFDLKVKEEKVSSKIVNGYSGAMPNLLVCYPITRLNPL